MSLFYEKEMRQNQIIEYKSTQKEFKDREQLPYSGDGKNDFIW